MTAFVYLFDRKISKWSHKSIKKKILKKNYKYIKMWWRRQKSNKKKQKFESIIIIKILEQNFIKYNECLSILIQKKFEQKLFCN